MTDSMIYYHLKLSCYNTDTSPYNGIYYTCNNNHHNNIYTPHIMYMSIIPFNIHNDYINNRCCMYNKSAHMHEYMHTMLHNGQCYINGTYSIDTYDSNDISIYIHKSRTVLRHIRNKWQDITQNSYMKKFLILSSVICSILKLYSLFQYHRLSNNKGKLN